MIRPLAAAILALSLLAPAARAEEAMKTSVLLKTSRTNIDQKIAYPRHGTPEITTMIVEIAPGAATPLHTHPVPLVAYMLQGELEVQARGRPPRRYKAGDSFVESWRHVHRGINVGSEPVRILVTVIGIKGTPYAIAAPRSP